MSAARRLRAEVTAPLARWGTTTLAVLALTTGQPAAALFCGAVALACWTVRPPRRARHRRTRR